MFQLGQTGCFSGWNSMSSPHMWGVSLRIQLFGFAIVLKDPLNNSAGWPDIFAYDGEKLRLIEVKTTDKLRESQKYTYMNIIREICLSVEVVQVIKK